MNREIKAGRLLYDKKNPMRIRRHRASIAQVFISSDRATISQSEADVKYEQAVYEEAPVIWEINTSIFKNEKSYMQEKEPNIKAYYKSDLPITIDSETFNVHLTVREDNQGNFFWDAQINKGSQHATPATNLGDTAPIDITISQSDENVNSDGKLYQKAFSASRVDYKHPSLEYIGTGEGNQAHGWGMYYALSKDVAEGYAERHGGGSYAQIFYLIFFI